MANQKIVMICMDEEYISSIEYKLTEAFEGKADFEYITSRSYFEQYMQEPQDIDVLIIQPNLWQEAARQNCKNVYLLVEHEQGGKQNQNVIYKYSSIRTIVDTIDSKLLYNGAHDREQESTRIVSVYSPIGGSGKTVTALGLAHTLSREGLKVLYISTECLQDYQVFYDNLPCLPDSVGYQCCLNAAQGAELMLTHMVRSEFDIIPPFSKPLAAYQIDFSKLAAIIDYFKKKNICDYIVVELSSEIEKEKMNFLMASDRTVIVARQELMATRKLELFLRGISEWQGQCVLLCNHYRRDMTDYLSKSNILSNYEICEYIEELQEGMSLGNVDEHHFFTKTALAVR